MGGKVKTTESSIRIIFLADTHLGFDTPLRPRIDIRRRGPDFFTNFDRVCDYVLAAKADVMVHGGDVFFRSRVPDSIVDMACQRFRRVADAGVPVFIVPGNHERSRLPTSLFWHHPNLHIFHAPTMFKLEIQGVKLALIGFPFVREQLREGFRSILAETGWQPNQAHIHVLCMHQTVENATVGPGNFTFRAAPDVIRPADLPTTLTAVLSGHIHRRQVLGNAPPVIYPGSIERTSFAEKDEIKGFYDLTLSLRDGNSVISKMAFIPLPTRPMIELTLEDLGVTSTNLYSLLGTVLHDIDPNAIVKLRSRETVPSRLLQKLNASRLRQIAPATMTIELSNRIFTEPHAA